MINRLYKIVFIAVCTFLFVQLPIYAQEHTTTNTNSQVATEKPPLPQDSLARDPPRSSFEGFLIAAEEGDFVKAAEYLDLRKLPGKYRSLKPDRLAQMLYFVIEREIWVDPENLSDNPRGEGGDGLPDNQDELLRIKDGEKEIVLLLQRFSEDDELLIWKISRNTVAIGANLYEKLGYGPFVEFFLNALPEGKFLGIEYFKLVVVIIVGLIAYPILALLGLGLARILSKPYAPMHSRIKRFFIGPVALLCIAYIIQAVLINLGVGITGQKILQAKTITNIIIIWLFLSGIGIVRDVYAEKLAERGREGTLVLLRPAAKIIQLIAIIVIILVWFDNLGFNITTLLAGLGVGGIAVALALQKPMEDVFGALSLYTQQPIHMGDFCRIGNEIGTIEEIGLRSTRVRTLADSVISIPNAKLANEAIDNYSARKKILYDPTLRLKIDTSREQMEKVLSGIRELLAFHEKIVKTNPRIRFQRIGEDALELKVFAYIDTQVFADYLEVVEDLNMKILDIVSSAGTTLALPGQTHYIERSSS